MDEKITGKICLFCKKPFVKLEKNKRHSKYCVPCAPKAYELGALKRKYGLTFEEYDMLLQKQNNRCAICKTLFEKKPCIDHDHSTKKVRGLLCTACNFLLGCAYDNVETLKRAILYLSQI